MHGLMGGSWKRSAAPATDAEKNNPDGKPRGAHGSTTYRRSTPPRQPPTLQYRLVPVGDHVVRSCSWWRRTRAAAVMAPIRQGHRLTRRSALNVVLSRELLRSAGARVAACSRLTVRSSAVSPRRGRTGEVQIGQPSGAAM